MPLMKTIAIDFDGVIHAYSRGWENGEIYDIPLDGVEEFILKQFGLGNTVIILSTRQPSQIIGWMDVNFPFLETEEISPELKFWNKERVIGITNRKLPAHIYIDDRGYKFEGTFPDTSTFKTWLE
jgi:hypothetical protein